MIAAEPALRRRRSSRPGPQRRSAQQHSGTSPFVFYSLRKRTVSFGSSWLSKQFCFRNVLPFFSTLLSLWARQNPTVSISCSTCPASEQGSPAPAPWQRDCTGQQEQILQQPLELNGSPGNYHPDLSCLRGQPRGAGCRTA